MAANTKALRSLNPVSRKIEDYKLLTKYRLSMTVVFTSMMAFILASPGVIDWVGLMVLTLGGMLITGAANALNQVLEKDYDLMMERTKNRPIATGRMSVSEAVLTAGLMALTGICLLAFFNVWASFLGTLALVSYAFVYTPMKRISTLAIPVGAFPGALPILIGCAAVEGEITAFALTLFTVQFFWQFPHFWAIGWLGFDDYKKAGFKLLPSVNGERDENTGLQSAIYAVVLAFIPILFYWNFDTTWLSIAVMSLAGLVYAKYGWTLYKQNSRQAARALMFFSFAYMPIILLVLLLDKYLF